METLEGGKAFNGGWGIVAGGDILLIKLPELFDRGAHSYRNGLKHACKGRRTGEPGGRDSGGGTVHRRNQGRAWEALESGIELVAVGSNWGGPRR